jgi:flagellar hook-length control protein FliK
MARLLPALMTGASAATDDAEQNVKALSDAERAGEGGTEAAVPALVQNLLKTAQSPQLAQASPTTGGAADILTKALLSAASAGTASSSLNGQSAPAAPSSAAAMLAAALPAAVREPLLRQLTDPKVALSYGSPLETQTLTPLTATTHADAGMPSNRLADDTASDIIQAIHLQALQGGGSATIQLEPRYFGNLAVSVRVEDGEVVAQLQAASPAVREWLEGNQQLLRQGLADQHLTLSRLEITAPPSESGASRDRRGDDPAAQQDPQARRQRRPRTGEVFEVVA